MKRLFYFLIILKCFFFLLVLCPVFISNKSYDKALAEKLKTSTPQTEAVWQQEKKKQRREIIFIKSGFCIIIILNGRLILNKAVEVLNFRKADK